MGPPGRPEHTEQLDPHPSRAARAAWTTGVAYYVASVFYQAATFGRHPLSSVLWIGGLTAAAMAVVAALRAWADRQPPAERPVELKVGG